MIGTLLQTQDWKYWVQISDEDDWIGQKEFDNMFDAVKLFEKILDSQSEDIYNQLDF